MNKRLLARAQLALLPLLLGSVAAEVLASLLCLDLGRLYPETARFAPAFAVGTVIATSFLQAALVALWWVLRRAARDQFFSPATARLFAAIRWLIRGAAAVLVTGGAYLILVARTGGPGVLLATVATIAVAAAFDQLAAVARAALLEAAEYRAELEAVI